jgi:radical SAM/Cys-rich protein
MTSITLPVVNDERFRMRFETDLRSATRITTLQVNIGYVCNLACRHCHVESSPARTAPEENMDEATARRVVEWALAAGTIERVDFTGGSPEMNPSFRWMVETLRGHGLRIMDRCNPTVIDYVDRKTGVGYEWVPAFLAEHEVEVIASLPCYLEENVEWQRGKGSYNSSMEGLRKLNDAGYGTDPRLQLNLVYNPNGPHLPPGQDTLEGDYRRELKQRYGLVFNELWTITNMPIKRWRHELQRQGQLEAYMTLLVNAFNASTIEGLMCRNQISIDPQGRLYDCDFNQALGLATPGHESRFLWDVAADQLANRVIATDDHCYGCTAGAGSSCGGALT